MSLGTDKKFVNSTIGTPEAMPLDKMLHKTADLFKERIFKEQMNAASRNLVDISNVSATRLPLAPTYMLPAINAYATQNQPFPTPMAWSNAPKVVYSKDYKTTMIMTAASSSGGYYMGVAYKQKSNSLRSEQAIIQFDVSSQSISIVTNMEMSEDGNIVAAHFISGSFIRFYAYDESVNRYLPTPLLAGIGSIDGTAASITLTPDGSTLFVVQNNKIFVFKREKNGWALQDNAELGLPAVVRENAALYGLKIDKNGDTIAVVTEVKLAGQFPVVVYKKINGRYENIGVNYNVPTTAVSLAYLNEGNARSNKVFLSEDGTRLVTTVYSYPIFSDIDANGEFTVTADNFHKTYQNSNLSTYMGAASHCMDKKCTKIFYMQPIKGTASAASRTRLYYMDVTNPFDDPYGIYLGDIAVTSVGVPAANTYGDFILPMKYFEDLNMITIYMCRSAGSALPAPVTGGYNGYRIDMESRILQYGV